MKRFLLALFAALALACLAPSQEFRGAISGAITDATGSMVAGASITVTETRTSTRVDTVSDNSGHYAVPFLLPGDYDISVKFAGFKEFIRKAIHLGAGEHPIIDVRLDVGEVTQSVEVTAEVPLINNENASIGQTVTTKEVEDLPTNGGTPMMLATFAMGVISTSQPSQVLPFASGGGASWSISGSPNQTNELLMDGVPNATWDGRLAYSPPQDAVQEVRVKAFDSDASYGHTAGGTANQVLKSGGNILHGTLSWKNQPNNLVANNFFNNKAGLGVQVTHFNQYGVTAGGPIYIPKVVDSRNRVFWFFAFEGVKASSPNTTFLTVPTPHERLGDFSKLLTVKSLTVIYDPATAVLNGTTVTRTAFPGNKIPANRLNPIALKYLDFFPQPNVTNLLRDDDYNNFGNNNTTSDGYTNELGRIDYNINSRNRTYFNVRHTDYYQNKNNYFSNISTGSNLSRSNWGASADHVFMLNAANVINVRANFTRMFEDHSSPSAAANPTTFGFPAYFNANSQYLQLPTMSFNTNTGLQTLGFGANANILPSQSLQLFGSWVAIRGAHTLKFGGDLRQYRLNYRSFGNSAGTFSFGNTWVRAASNASSTVSMGQDLSSFLLGLPTGGSFDINTSASFYSYYGSLFAQDDWRVSRTFTVNAGLRFDHDFPYHEKWGRTVNGFAFDAASPLAAAAEAAYAKAPSPLLSPGDFKVRGGLTFANPENSAIYQNTSQLSPRVGFAWTPEKLHRKVVVRSGFAMFVSPITISTLQINGSYSTNPILTQQGFSQSTPFTPTNDNYLTPSATLSNPFPGGIQQPAGSSNGLLTYAGQNINFINPQMKSPYAVRWNLSTQYQIAPNMVLEIAYIGNHSLHIPVTYTQLNGIPVPYRSTMGTRDQALITTLNASTPNPFRGLQTSTGTSTTVSTAQILARYPQFPQGTNQGSSGVVMQNFNAGSSYYNSLNVRLQKRLSGGFSLIANFMKSKGIDQTTWLNDSDPQPERRISPFFRPMRLSSALTYEFPVGRGKRINFQSRLLDLIIGGWQTTGTYTFQVGGPLIWVNGSTNNPGDYVYFGGKLDPNPRGVDGTAFNTRVFDTASANQLQYHIRTFSTAFADVRSDGINDWAASMLKKFSLGERRFLQLRVESFNFINHAAFGAANTTVTNSAFGTITSQANRPRTFQLVARIVF